MNRKQNLLGFPNQTQSRTVFSQLLPRHYGKAHIPLKNRIGGHVLLYRQELLSDIPAYVLQGQFLLKHSFLPLIPGGKNPPAFSVNQTLPDRPFHLEFPICTHIQVQAEWIQHASIPDVRRDKLPDGNLRLPYVLYALYRL